MEALSEGYEDTLKLLYQLSSRSRLGPLSIFSTEKLCAYLGHPERSYPVIHVAGTNGKGSVVHKTAAVLQAGGYRVGVFTSPHVSSYRERIRVNETRISQEAVTRLVNKLTHTAQLLDQGVTFFELTTLMAFLYFAEQKVDVAVLEVGLGGRLDSTNVVQPMLTAITSIGWDHMNILGSTLDAIAIEKGGIIKEGVPVVLGPTAQMPVLIEQAKKMRSPYILVDIDTEKSELQNQAIVRQLFAHLPFRLSCSEPNIEAALQSRPPCRFERVGPFVLDVAHNEAALLQLLRRLQSEFSTLPKYPVFCFSKQKAIAEAFVEWVKECETLILVAHGHHRLMNEQELRSVSDVAAADLHKLSICNDLGAALNRQRELAERNGGIVPVTGSFFHMAEARRFVGISEDVDPFELNEQLDNRGLELNRATR